MPAHRKSVLVLVLFVEKLIEPQIPIQSVCGWIGLTLPQPPAPQIMPVLRVLVSALLVIGAASLGPGGLRGTELACGDLDTSKCATNPGCFVLYGACLKTVVDDPEAEAKIKMIEPDADKAAGCGDLDPSKCTSSPGCFLLYGACFKLKTMVEQPEPDKASTSEPAH